MRLFLTLWSLMLFVPLLAGCGAPPSAPDAPEVAVERPPLEVWLSRQELHLSARPETAQTRFVTYTITRPDSPDFSLQLQSDVDSDFHAALSVTKLYPGAHTIRVFADGSVTPFHVTTFDLSPGKGPGSIFRNPTAPKENPARQSR